MRHLVIISDTARAEVREAGAYLSVHASPEVTDRWYLAFEQAITSLETMPASNPFPP